jgi:hypothetical protein
MHWCFSNFANMCALYFSDVFQFYLSNFIFILDTGVCELIDLVKCIKKLRTKNNLVAIKILI